MHRLVGYYNGLCSSVCKVICVKLFVCVYSICVFCFRYLMWRRFLALYTLKTYRSLLKPMI